MRMIVVMPTWTSSLTTMLIDGAPIPLVAHTTGAPPGSVATNESSPRLRASAPPSPRCSLAISSDAPGSPLSRAIVVPSGRSATPEPDVVLALVRRHGSGLYAPRRPPAGTVRRIRAVGESMGP